MTEFREQDLTEAQFERVNLRGASFTHVSLNDARMRAVDFTGAQFRGRMILGNVSPWHQLDLPWDEAPGWDGIPWDREAEPSLDDVLTVRRERQAMVRQVMESLTDEQLASEVTQTRPGWPQLENFPFKECLHIVLTEEWEHRLYSERDLTALDKEN